MFYCKFIFQISCIFHLSIYRSKAIIIVIIIIIICICPADNIMPHLNWLNTECNQRCEKQNVTQCPAMKCIGNACQQYCMGSSKCSMSCSGGSRCIQECQGGPPGGCEHVTCSSSECLQTCGHCTMECTSSVKKCQQYCTGGNCHLKCLAADCKPECSRGTCTYSGGTAVRSSDAVAVVTLMISMMFIAVMWKV